MCRHLCWFAVSKLPRIRSSTASSFHFPSDSSLVRRWKSTRLDPIASFDVQLEIQSWWQIHSYRVASATNLEKHPAHLRILCQNDSFVGYLVSPTLRSEYVCHDYVCHDYVHSRRHFYRIDFRCVSKRLYMCIETTSICIETTCIEKTLYRNDRIPFERYYKLASKVHVTCIKF